jgi:predicted phage terminase large subunit-like protein
MCDAPEVLFGGAAGGGKSDAMLMAALQYVHVPNYSALILRRTYPQLSQEGGLIPRSHEWLAGTDAKWNEQKKAWTFPSGAVMAFGHLQYENTKYDYQSGEYQFIGFEELTQYSETQYRYLHSRLRRLEGSVVPIRMRATSNPGGIGHDWVRARFVDAHEPDRCFIPSALADNPSLDRATYELSLDNLDPLTREQLLNGDWTVRERGGMFDREWFEIVESAPAAATAVRYWDLAATEMKPGTDPDWTVGAKVAFKAGITYVCDIRRVREKPGVVERLIISTAETDGHSVAIYMEQEPGSSGVNVIDHYRRNVLPSHTFYGDKVTGPKTERARPLSSAAQGGNVKLVRGPWNAAFIDEAEVFPSPAFHDDQIDAVSGARSKLTRTANTTRGLSKPQGW